MRKDKLLDQLQNTTPVPDIVLEKREQAFEAIRQREEMRTETIAGGGRMQSGRMQARRGGVRKGILLAAAAVLLIGTLAFAAVSRNWGSLEHSLGLSEEDKETLEKSGVAKGTELAAEDDGITITVQSVAAGRYQAVLSFLVQGVTLPEDAGPGLAVPFLRSVQGKTEEEADWAEYSPWVRFEESVTGDSPDQEDVAYQKGEEIPEIAGEPSVRFLSEEGSLSFFVVLSHRNWEKEDVYTGKRLDLHLEDIILPVLSHGQRQELCFPGSWDFTLTLPEGGEQYQPVLWDDQQENLPVQVTRCEISPPCKPYS